MMPTDVDRIFGPDREPLEIGVTSTRAADMLSSAGDPIPVQVQLVPDSCINVRTVIEGHLVDIAIYCPYDDGDGFEVPVWRLGVMVDERDATFYEDLSELVIRTAGE